ncbi:Neutral/alkaline non-lysosomal ceramidase [Colletotrichum higginsianum IMI 349063]|uniref:Neutral/alkaline non-lysosomal ceramidase n=2 Tax=Colletotrichum higginsianum (strain IMI 349063) TaxID=759273 RepID=A0A1B7YMA8_COLHI|nr:Neutral/alkaline non-lysosomal ceramidase [Colletotrichum higginsianum IMI 349063]OBR13180.1 Neutral/alkaline non-lysosomal ceramidase [Colletotrichum higginsianum IMI 349063]
MDLEQSQEPGSQSFAKFCEQCSVVLFNDSADEFSEGTNWNNEPTLRHSREGGRIIILEHVRGWKDTLPDLPRMAESSRAGCSMCGFVREALLRRNVDYEGDVFVRGGYLWGGQGDAMDVSATDPGLAFWRCEVYKVARGTRENQVAVLNFGIETSNDDVLQWLRLDEKCASEPLDPDNVEWLKSELRSCEDDCGHAKPASSFLPTRLIDVGQSEKDVPRLVVTEDMLNSRTVDDVEYAALSYCWGPKEDALQQTKTTKDTMSTHYQGMPLSSLSPVVRDTVKVCRTLDIRYLWVDALCIIQGDKADWDRESQMMGQVYYSCSVAICPVSSRSCLEGYLGVRPRGLDVAFQSSRHQHIRGTYKLVPSSTDSDEDRMGYPRPGPPLYLDLSRSSWDQRGWTFQELVLSPRMIIFGPLMSHFVCETKTKSENGDVGTDQVHGPLRAAINQALGEGFDEMDRSAKSVREVYRQWTYVGEVQRRIWTYRTDIFPGLSGLAQAFAAITGDTYLAGLWKNNLHHQLVWEIARPLPGDLASLVDSLQHADPYIAPSWSWASRTSYHEHLPDWSFAASSEIEEMASAAGEKEKAYFLGVSLPSHVRPEFDLIDYRMDLQGSNLFRPLNGAFLQIKGRMCPFPSDVRRESLGPSGDCRPSYGRFSGGIGTCMLDWGVGETSVQTPESMRLFLVSSCCSATLEWRRAKWFADCDDEDFDDWMPSDAEVGGSSFPDGYESIETCRYCADPKHKRTGWGLVVHPTKESGSYVRVGAFVFFAHKGGTDLFIHKAEEIILV